MTDKDKEIRKKILSLIDVRRQVQETIDWDNPVQALRDIELCQELTGVGSDLFRQLPEEMRINLNAGEA
jgi:hypothetical protein